MFIFNFLTSQHCAYTLFVLKLAVSITANTAGDDPGSIDATKIVVDVPTSCQK